MWYFAGEPKKDHSKDGLQLKVAIDAPDFGAVASSIWDWYGALDVQTSDKCDRLFGGVPADPAEIGKKVAILRFTEKPSALGPKASVFSVEHQSVHYIGIIKDGKNGFAAIIPVQKSRIPAQAIRRILSPSILRYIQ